MLEKYASFARLDRPNHRFCNSSESDKMPQFNQVVCEMSSECKHNFCPLLILPARPDHVMEACKECEEIRGYHVNSKESDVIVEECSVER